MSNTLAFVRGNNLFTSSSIISVGVQIEHRAVLQLIKKYIDKLKTFGDVLFETESFKTAGGNQKREVAVLNEPQTTLLLTFFKNTEIVVNFKLALVKTFYELKERLNQQEQDNSLITSEQQYEISSHVMRKTHALFGSRNYSAVYRALKRRFRIPRYTCLLNRDYETALKFIDSLTKDDFNVPDVPEKSTQEIQEVSKTAIVKPMTRRLYQVNSYSFTFNVNNMESFEKPSKVVTELPYLPKRRIEITEEELHSIKVLVYYFEVLFKPLIQWAEQEARRQHHPLASRFYDVWCEPIISMSALKRIIRRNEPDYV